jgi:hypothetical protein
MFARKKKLFFGGVAGLKVSDVFATALYAGTNGTGTGTNKIVTNGINLASKGGLVWIKGRSGTNSYNHFLMDSVGTGLVSSMSTNLINALTNAFDSMVSFNSDGFTLGADTATQIANYTGENYTSWSFAKAPKFFDVQTFTAGSNANRRISHNLGVAPGFVVMKDMSGAQNWYAYHISSGRSVQFVLNSTAAGVSASNVWGASDPTSIDFGINESSCTSGHSYLLYLFAHDPTGVIQCGTFTTDGSGNATVSLGWQPQFLLVKRSNGSENWYIVDTTRGWGSGNDNYLIPNLSNAENSPSVSDLGAPSGTGFSSTLTASANYIYMAIKA